MKKRPPQKDRKEEVKALKELHTAVRQGEEVKALNELEIMMLQEGLWSKLKHIASKFGSLEKGGKLFGDKEAAYAEKIGNALETASDKTVKNLHDKLKEEYPGFPNMEENVDFLGALMQIGVVYDSIVAGVEAGEIGPIEANAVITQLRGVIEYYKDYELADVYKHMKEGEEIEEDDEVLDEKVFPKLRAKQLGKLMDRAADGRVFDRGIKALERAADKAFKNADTEIMQMFQDKLGDTELSSIADRARRAHGYVKRTAQAAGTVGTTVGGGGGGGAAVTGGGGGAAVTGGGGGAGALGTSPLYAQGAQTIGTGATSLGAGAAAAFILGTLAVGAVTSGVAIAALRAKSKKSSRTQQFDAVLDSFQPVPIPEDLTQTAEAMGVEAPTEDAEAEAEVDAVADAEAGAVADAEAGAAPAEAGKGDIYVFKGKGGKGMQSQLAKAGIQGAEMSALLKGLRADLTTAGFNVLEEAERETIALKNTLGAIEQMKDPAHKEAAKAAVANLLRQHKVRVDQESGMGLKKAAPAAAEAPGAEAPAAAEPAAGGEKPPLDPAQTARAAQSTKDIAARGAPKAEPEQEPCKPGHTRNKEGACVPFGSPGINETLDRWHKLAGIIKG